MEEKIKIAICSPDITNLGGISRCVVVLIEALNKKGIVPDYYGVRSDKKKIKELFNREIRYNFKRIFWLKKALLYSSWIKNLQLIFKTYDYIFDFTNTLPISNNQGNYFSYILYPEFLTSRGKYNKGFWRIYYLPHRIIAFLRRGLFKNPKIDIACVSLEISNLIYNLFGNRFPVLYPPANITDFKNEIIKKSGVISVGGFTHEKNQIEQINIAKKFPEIKFDICGSSKRNPSYYKYLIRASNKVKNIKLNSDIPFNALKEKLSHTEVFLNSGREDPFSMAIVEGIAAGCIPLIHNSGGVVEIVPFEELKYDTIKDAIKKLKNILDMPKAKKKELKERLQEHIQQFGEKYFIRQLFTIMNHKLKYKTQNRKI